MGADNGGMDQVTGWSRLFLVPGMGHCAGGAATLDTFDLLGAMVEWVEQATRPMPSSPPVARFRGEAGRSAHIRCTRTTKARAMPKTRRTSSVGREQPDGVSDRSN